MDDKYTKELEETLKKFLAPVKVNLKHEFNASAKELYLCESLLANGEIKT